MTRTVEHSYIPNDLIEKGPEIKPQPDALDILTSKTPLYLDFQPLGDLSHSENLGEAFQIQPSEDGILYISKKTYVEDLEGNHIPRALLITSKGEELLKQNHGILKKIDEQTAEERTSHAETVWTKNSSSGVVRIVSLEDGSSVAVKRFKRYKDGRKLHVGGLEQAEAHLKLNNIFAAIPDFPCKMAAIYFASQDVVVMENIEQLPSLADFLEEHPETEATVWETVEDIDRVITGAFEKGEIKGLYENLLGVDPTTKIVVKSVALKHLFIDDYNPKSNRISFVMIDPNI